MKQKKIDRNKTEKSPDRLAVIEKIKEYERQELFHLDVENDPEWQPLDSKKVDFLNKKLSSKIKTFFAYRFGEFYFERLIKKKAVVWAGVKGLENLQGFTGGAIVTCNHCHQFDNYAVLIGLRKFFTNMPKRLYKIVREGNYSFKGLLGFILRNCDTLPVNERDNQNLRLTAECMRAVRVLLKKGKKILVYPEQGMWWNYRKPRPFKKGAFLFAAKFDSPVIPCFLTMKDTDIIGADGFPVQEFTLNVLPVIYPNPELSVEQNCENMKNKNFDLWKNIYEKTYGEKLAYGESINQTIQIQS